MVKNKTVILDKVRKLHRCFEEGQIPTLAIHEVYPEVDRGSRERYLYFTLAPALNFQRLSPALWQAALKTWNDPQTNYLFFPELVINTPREKVQLDLIKHRLSLQKNKHTDIWITICQTLHEYYHDDPREIFKVGEWDVVNILNILQIEQRKNFPYLSGPKLSNYWLFKVSEYTDAKFKNMHQISIIPDTHVIQATVVLGITDKLSGPIIVADAWRDLLEGSELTPVQIHPVLWNWSRNNFKPTP
jgi:hypothetical protein